MASSLPLDYSCTDTEASLALWRMMKGFSPPENVLDSVNPFQLHPQYLPVGVWYHVKGNGNENEDLSSGFWKPKGGDCKLPSDFPFTIIKTTYEFYEGQAPNDHKTAWVMLEYWICRSDMPANNNGQKTSSLCKVFIGDEQFQDHEKFKKIRYSIVRNSEPNCPIHQLVGLGPDGSNNKANGSTSKAKMIEDGKMVELMAVGKPFDHHLDEIFSVINSFPGDDFIELLDLDIPLSSAADGGKKKKKKKKSVGKMKKIQKNK